MNDYLRIKEVAERLAVSEQTVRKLVRLGKLDAIRIGNRSLRITRESIDAYIASRKQD